MGKRVYTKPVSAADRKRIQDKRNARAAIGSGKQDTRYEPIVSKKDRDIAKQKQKARQQGRNQQSTGGGLAK